MFSPRIFKSSPPTLPDGGQSQPLCDNKGNMLVAPGAIGAKTPAASQSVIAAGLEYEIVAAGVTGQVMGGTGVAGDYLSHVIFYPATTGAGTSIVLDNAIEVAKITTGTLGDLRPIVVPINAFSVSGAWKITTGANMTATAFGDFAA